jgi:hypothetical protein
MDFYELQARCPGNLAVPRALSSGVAPIFFQHPKIAKRRFRKYPNNEKKGSNLMS